MAAANLCDPLADEQLNVGDQQQQQQPTRWIEKSVIIHRDEHGFGLRVGGQNPVFVDYVHENGAASRAGVRTGDLIIKVNGTLVKSLNHKIVVDKIQTSTTFVNLTLHSPVDPPALIGGPLLGVSATHRASSTNLSAYHSQRGHINLHSQAPTCSTLGPQSSASSTTSPSSLIPHHLMQQIPAQNQQRYQQGTQELISSTKGNSTTHAQIGQQNNNNNIIINNHTSSVSYTNHANNSQTIPTGGNINNNNNGKKGSNNVKSSRLINIDSEGHNHNLHHLMSSSNSNPSISKPMISRPNPIVVSYQTMSGSSFSTLQQNSVFVKANSEIIHHPQQQVTNQFSAELLVWQTIENLFSELISRNAEIQNQDIKLTLLQFFHYCLTTQRHSTHPTLFFVIAELYRAHAAESLMARCNKRELSLVKRWAFEIFSTFLIPNAPLAFASFDQKKLDKIADIINNQSPICSSLSVSSSPALIVSGSYTSNSNSAKPIHSLSNNPTSSGSISSSATNVVSKNSAEYMQLLVNIFESVSQQTADIIKNQIEDFEKHLVTENLRDPVVNSTITAAAAAIVGILCDMVSCKLSPSFNQGRSNTNTLTSVDSGFGQRNSSLSMRSSQANASISGDTISLSSVSTSISRNSLEVVSLSDAVNLLVVKIEQVMLSGLSPKDEETARDFISLLAQITSFATILRIALNQQLLVTGNIATFLSTNYPSTRRCASSVEPGGLHVTAGSSITGLHKSSNSQPHKRHKSLPASSAALNSSNPSVSSNHIVETSTGHLHPLQNLLQSSTNISSSGSKQTNSTSTSTSNQSSSNDHIELNGHNFISYCDTAVLYCNGCGLPLFAWFSYACSSCEVYSHRWCLKRASETACIDTTKNSSSGSASRSGKTSARSSKYRPRNLRSRLVEDLKSLKITPQPVTASSSSSSSSSLTDCDQDTTWLEYYQQQDSRQSTGDVQQIASSLDSKNYQSNEDLLLFGDENLMLAGSSSSTHSLQNVSSSSVASQATATVATASQSEIAGTYDAGDNIQGDSSINISQQQQPLVNRQKSTTKRLEIIKELLETERAHVGRLKHLDDLFYKPLIKESMMTPEQSAAVFSCHKRLYKIHKQIYRTLISARTTTNGTNGATNCEPLLGKVLIQVFLSDIGKQLEQASCEFCACQATNSDILNKLIRRDSKAADFLAQAGNQPSIGRLGIKDLLASCFQRLTKYPLLLENLLKTTPKERYVTEHDNIKEALNKSREILVHVDDAVKMSVSQHRLMEIWRRTDKHASIPSLDIANQILLHDGPLVLRLRNRSVDVHVLLMTDYLVILTKDSQVNKFKLRHFSQDGSKSASAPLKPIFDVDKDLETRNIATDGNAFYLLRTEKDDSRMYEFCSHSPSDRAKWSEKIQLAVDQKKKFLSLSASTCQPDIMMMQHKRMQPSDILLPTPSSKMAASSQPSLNIRESSAVETNSRDVPFMQLSRSGLDLTSATINLGTANNNQEQKIQQIDSEIICLLEQRRALVCSAFDINQADLDLILDTSNHDHNANIRLNLACSAMTVTELLLCESNNATNSENTLREAILKLKSHLDSFLQNDDNNKQ